MAAAYARSTRVRQRPLSAGPPPTGPSSASRTALPNNPDCSIVWLAPVPIIAGGRSALSTSSGTPACDASSTAGCRFATAVPDVVHTGTGRPERTAIPSARNPAVRSSMRTCSRSRPAASAACSANDSGALREPGHSTASVTPQRTSSSTSTRACIVDGFTPTSLCSRGQLSSTNSNAVANRAPGRRAPSASAMPRRNCSGSAIAPPSAAR